MAWEGYFAKILDSDHFVILDNVQFTKGSYINRCPVVINGQDKWITIPVMYKYGMEIREVKFVKYHNDSKKILETIRHITPFAFEVIHDILERNYLYLIDLNIALIQRIMKILEINVPMSFASELGYDETLNKSDKILDINLCLGSSGYVCGGGKNKYLDLDAFNRNGIDVIFTDYSLTCQKTSILYKLNETCK